MHLSAILCLFGVDVGFIGVTGLRRGEHSSDEEKGEDGTRVGTRTMESSRKELGDYYLLYLTSFFGAVVKIEALFCGNLDGVSENDDVILSIVAVPASRRLRTRGAASQPTSRLLKLSQHLEHTL